MQADDEHLRPNEIASLLNSSRAENGDLKLPIAGHRTRHFDDCQECRNLLEIYRKFKTYADRSLPAGQFVSSADCPPPSRWYELAAGLAAPDEAESLLDHATTCPSCGYVFGRASEDLTSEPTEEEKLKIGELSSAHPAWQKQMSDALSAERVTKRPPLVAKPYRQTVAVWGWAVAAIAVVAFVLVWLSSRDTLEKVEHLSATAYGQNRLFDFRIANGQYGPIRAQRGNVRVESPALLEARVMLSHLERRYKDTPEFLLVRGRVELLSLDFEPALADLNHVRDLNPQSLPVLTDIAALYAVLGDSGNSEAFSDSLELLDNVLRQAPNDPIALFNRALLYERLQSFSHAVKDWQSFLRQSSSGPWAEEARQHCAADVEKLQNEKENDQDPSSLLRDLRSSSDDRKLLANTEELLDDATADWIRTARLTTKDEFTRLASLTVRANADYWVQDLLAQSKSPLFDEAAEHLATAVSENLASNHDAALLDAQKSESEFHQIQNLAGELRARLEVVYAYQRRFEPKICLEESKQVAEAATSRHYNWIATQNVIEESACESELANYPESLSLLDSAGELAGKFHYKILAIRVVGLHAAVIELTGAARDAWSQNLSGLSEYWSGLYPPIRAYQFYSEMTNLGEKSKNWCASVNFGEEARRAAHQTPYRYAEAIAEFRLADDSKNCGDNVGAIAHYEVSSKLFAQLPPTRTISLYALDAEIRRANLQSELGHSSESLPDLLALKSRVDSQAPSETVMRYYNTVARLARNTGDLATAGNAYEASTAIAAGLLRGVSTEKDRAGWLHESAVSFRGMVDVLVRRGDFAAALEVWESYRGGQSKSQAANFNTDRVSDSVDSPPKTIETQLSTLINDTFISIMRADDGLDIWVYDSVGIDFRHVTVAPKEVDQTVGRFIELCSSPSSDKGEISTNARRLYDWFIAPVESRISPARTLIIEADDPDRNLPFGAFQTHDGQYLASTLQIARVDSFDAWIDSRAVSRISSNDNSLFVASPSIAMAYLSEFPPLPDALAEASSIAAMFPHSRVLSGHEATIETVTTNLKHATVLYFGGHSVSDSSKVGLVLATSHGTNNHDIAILTPAALSARDLQGLSLIVLASCSTGKNPRSNQDPQSIAQAFASIGVPNVVAAQWDVDSETTSTFMKSFYQSLLTGTSVAGSIRSAAKVLLAGPDSSHPYYWAAFTVFGRG